MIAIELQGHGHTRDIDRPFSYEAFGDDIAALIEALELGEADLLGYSLGAGASLRCAIQHPDRVRRLALVSTPCSRDGWFPEVLAAMEQVRSGAFEMMRRSHLYEGWAAVAPDRDAFPTLMDRTGELLRRPYDWRGEVAKLTLPVLLVYADADSIPPAHAAEFYALLGGGLRDAGWDGSAGDADAARDPARADPLRRLRRAGARPASSRTSSPEPPDAPAGSALSRSRRCARRSAP